MKNKVLILSSMFFIFLIVGIVALFYNENSKAIIESGRNNSIVKNNALTMMYETEYQSGEYQVTSDSLWLDSDSYTFNQTLSSCENGGQLMWSDETNRVVMQTNSSDRCYVYFDALPTSFDNLQKLIDDNYGGTVYMTEDVYSESKSLEINGAINIYGNGHTISVGEKSNSAININTNGNVVLNDINIDVVGNNAYGINA